MLNDEKNVHVLIDFTLNKQHHFTSFAFHKKPIYYCDICRVNIRQFILLQ